MRRLMLPEQNSVAPWRLYIKLTEVLVPGDDAYGYLMRYDKNGALVATTTSIRVYDPLKRNYGLEDELFPIQWHTAKRRFEMLGSMGLLRRAKADDAISVGGSGTVSIWTSAGDSNENVTAYNTWNAGAVNTDDQLWVAYQHKDDQWVILAAGGEGGSNVRRFQLSSNLAYSETAGQYASAYLLDWDGGTWVTGTSVTVQDMMGAFGPATPDARGWCVQMADHAEKYEIIFMEGDGAWLWFVAAGDRYYYDGTYKYDIDMVTPADTWGGPGHDEHVTPGGVWDRQNKWARGCDGCRGVARLQEDTGRYEIIWMEQEATIYRMELAAKMAYGAAEGQWTAVAPVDGVMRAGTQWGHNLFDLFGAVGDKGYAFYDPTLDYGWVITIVPERYMVKVDADDVPAYLEEQFCYRTYRESAYGDLPVDTYTKDPGCAGEPTAQIEPYVYVRNIDDTKVEAVCHFKGNDVAYWHSVPVDVITDLTWCDPVLRAHFKRIWVLDVLDLGWKEVPCPASETASESSSPSPSSSDSTSPSSSESRSASPSPSASESASASPTASQSVSPSSSASSSYSPSTSPSGSASPSTSPSSSESGSQSTSYSPSASPSGSQSSTPSASASPSSSPSSSYSPSTSPSSSYSPSTSQSQSTSPSRSASSTPSTSASQSSSPSSSYSPSTSPSSSYSPSTSPSSSYSPSTSASSSASRSASASYSLSTSLSSSYSLSTSVSSSYSPSPETSPSPSASSSISPSTSPSSSYSPSTSPSSSYSPSTSPSSSASKSASASYSPSTSPSSSYSPSTSPSSSYSPSTSASKSASSSVSPSTSASSSYSPSTSPSSSYSPSKSASSSASRSASASASESESLEECGGCLAGTAPQFLSVTISDITESQDPDCLPPFPTNCEECDIFHGTFQCEFQMDAVDYCQWAYRQLEYPGGDVIMWINVQVYVSGRLEVTAGNASSDIIDDPAYDCLVGGTIVWAKQLTPLVDCANLNETLTGPAHWESDNSKYWTGPGIGGCSCHGASATIRVVA